ncbi:MAG TPA: diacylglycerol kinase family protein [Terriglobia bacterium]|nr:diacylglycerol kinase family protein [Terriglobia bacterium]
MSPALLIANPIAGQDGPARRQEAVERFCALMAARGVDVEARTTTGPRDASRLAAEAARQGFTTVIVSGGDGTVNEALQGLIGTGVRLAVWPRGTANVLGLELRLPQRLEKLADVIAAGKVIQARVASVTIEKTGENRCFLLMAGIGLDAAIVDRVRPELKKRLGKAAFWYSGLESLALWRPHEFLLEIDGHEYSATFAALGKTPRYGGNLAITPRARLDHPHFEICLIHSKQRLRYLQLLPFAMFGGIPETMKGISYLRATQVRARGDGVLAQIDGELIGSLPMTFAITPHVIELVTGG